MLKKTLAILCIMTVTALGVVGCSKSDAAAPKSASETQTKSNYPNRSVEIMVPYNPGSSVDINARALSPSLERALKGTVVVNNKGGASGALGFNYIAKAKPDGYSIGIANIASIVATASLSNAGFDPVKDLKFIGTTATDVFLIAAPAKSPYNSIKDVVEYLKKNPGGLKYGASGAMSMDAMLAYNIESAGNVDLNIVSFNGGGEIVASILGGHIDLYGGALSEIYPLVKDGKVKILGVGGDTRAPELPNVPTFKEQGYTMAFNMAKRAIYVPANTDPAVVKILEEAVKKAVADPDFIEKAKTTGLKAQYLSAEESLKEAQTVAEWFKANKSKISVSN